MTEANAKTLRCPIMHLAAMVFFAHRPNSMPAGPHSCIGSGCAMWQWDASVEEIVGYQEGIPVKTEMVKGGHCGLVGKP